MKLLAMVMFIVGVGISEAPVPLSGSIGCMVCLASFFVLAYSLNKDEEAENNRKGE